MLKIEGLWGIQKPFEMSRIAISISDSVNAVDYP